MYRRKVVQARLDKGDKPHFLPETRRIRERDWKVGFDPAPSGKITH